MHIYRDLNDLSQNVECERMAYKLSSTWQCTKVTVALRDTLNVVGKHNDI